MPVILDECEVWSAIVREEYRLGELGDRTLRISEPKREGTVTDAWRKLPNGGILNLYPLPHIRMIKSRRLEIGMVCSRREKIEEYTYFSRKSEEKRQL
jgi:hypothetical protein